jgi:hypothetical protein
MPSLISTNANESLYFTLTVTVMKHVLSRTVALALHRDFSPTTYAQPSIPRQNLPLFNWIHFIFFHLTSFQLTAFFVISTTPSLHLMYHFPNPFCYDRLVYRKVSKVSVGRWLQSCMTLFTKEYFLMSVLCFLLLIFLYCGPRSDSKAFVIYRLRPSMPFLPRSFEESTYANVYVSIYSV